MFSYSTMWRCQTYETLLEHFGDPPVIVKGKGDNLGGLPPTPLALPMRVQLQATNGQCWEASFFASGVVRNETGFFKGKAGSPSGAFLDR